MKAWRSIVERYKIAKPRQIRWTDDQIVELARMAGIVSFNSQAKYFNRPNANEGSIKSAWMKKFGNGGGSVHGMSQHSARHLVTKDCPFLVTAYWNTRRGNSDFSRKLYLWTDMERHLRPGVPVFIMGAIKQMAEFQRWLFGSQDPKKQILTLIRARQLSK